MIEETTKYVKQLLDNEMSGHGFDHVNRVYNLALDFCQKEGGNKLIVALASLLHDVDDYKIFGLENAKNLTNAKDILNKVNAPKDIQESVLNIISSMGYNKLLRGIRPSTLEGKIVSDADMCDAVGAMGIIRTHKYSITHGSDFFDKNTFPVEDMTSENYMSRTSSSSVCHFFEKSLKLKNLMLTTSGKIELEERHNFLVSFLKQTFKETNSPQWNDYLTNFLNKLYLQNN